MIFGLRKGDEIPTLSYLWVMPLNLNCASVQEIDKNHSKQKINQEMNPILHAMRTYLAPALFNSKIK